MMAGHSDYHHSIREVMAELAGRPMAESGVDERLSVVAAAAVRLIRGADWADILLIEGDQYRSIGATDAMMTRLDDKQLVHGHGPCLEAAVSDAIVRSTDLTRETRWPQFRTAALAAGVRSMLTFQLFSHDHGRGALNLFARAAGEFNSDDEAVGAVLAAHAASVLTVGREMHTLISLLADRDVVGQAKGILMERFKIGAIHAFELMLTCSRSTGASLADIADAIITTPPVAEQPRE